MEKKSCERCIRWICAILFSAFAFCWLFFLQNDLISAEISSLFAGNSNLAERLSGSHVVVSLVLTVIALLLAIPGRILLRFKKGLYACNYLFSATFLGVITGFDGYSILGQSYTVWMVTVVFIVVLFLVCKIIASVPRSEYNDRPRTLAGNLLLMSVLFTMVGYLGNTDENLHRRLRMEKLFSEGECTHVLEIGRHEEESDPDIDLLRAKSMLNLPSSPNPTGSEIGEFLFRYSISDPHALSNALKAIGGEQANLAACLLDGNLTLFSDTINYDAYATMPTFYMQALVMINDSTAQTKFPQQYADEQLFYDSFCDALEPLEYEPKQFQANSTYIPFHETYFWFYTFRK